MKNSENQGSKTKNRAVKPTVEPNKQGSNKKKFALYIDPELLEKVDDLYEEQNCGSRSEFINRAIRNYIGQVVSDKHVGYLAPLIHQMVDASIDLSEMRINRNLFKIAVELGKLTHLMVCYYGKMEKLYKSQFPEKPILKMMIIFHRIHQSLYHIIKHNKLQQTIRTKPARYSAVTGGFQHIPVPGNSTEEIP